MLLWRIYYSYINAYFSVLHLSITTSQFHQVEIFWHCWLTGNISYIICTCIHSQSISLSNKGINLKIPTKWKTPYTFPSNIKMINDLTLTTVYLIGLYRQGLWQPDEPVLKRNYFLFNSYYHYTCISKRHTDTKELSLMTSFRCKMWLKR